MFKVSRVETGVNELIGNHEKEITLPRLLTISVLCNKWVDKQKKFNNTRLLATVLSLLHDA